MADYPYVPLSRIFLDISLNDSDDETGVSIFRNRKHEKSGATWEELEDLDCAVILGSAGSGKTREIHERAKELRRRGCNAFVLRLEALCKNPVEDSFSFQDENGPASFAAWKKKGGDAFAFLDALDEARLPDARNASALGEAMTHLSKSIGNAGNNLKIILTTRPTEWQGDSDKSIIQTTLRGLRSRQKREQLQPELKVNVFRLGPLEPDAISRLAISRQVEPKPFLAAIDNARVANLATQPLDVHLLLDLWSDEIASDRQPALVFTSRKSIFEKIVESRIRREHGQERRSNLDRINVRNACEKLAAVAALSDVRDFSVEIGKQDAILVEEALATDVDKWGALEARQLLSYGIFHPSVSGRVRFAHREIQDYLAAHYFDKAIDKNAGLIEVIFPLLATGYGKDEIPQSTEHILGWLSSLNAVGRKLVTRLRPSLLIETGDPSELTTGEKSQALVSHVSLYKNRKYRGEWFYQTDIQTFATPDLAPAIRQQLAASKSPEVREFLIELARFGKMAELGKDLADIACDDGEALRVRAEACLALAELGLPIYANAVIAAALSAPPPEIEDTESAPGWNLFQSAALSNASLAEYPVMEGIAIVSRLRREPRNYSSSTPYYINEFASKIPNADRINWLHIFVRFATGPRTEQNDWMPSTKLRFNVLASAICSLLTRVLETASDNCPRELIFDAIEYLFQHDHVNGFSWSESPYEELAASLHPLVAVKLELVQRRIDRFAHFNSAFLIADYAIRPLEFENEDRKISIFTVQDVEALTKVLEGAQDAKAKEIAAYCATQITQKLSDPSARIKASKIIGASIKRYGTKELRSVYSILAPLKRIYFAFRQLHFYRFRRWVSSIQIIALNKYWKFRNAIQFSVKFREISKGKSENLLLWAVTIQPNKLGSETIEQLRKEYCSWIANNFSQGFRKYWRENIIAVSERNTNRAKIGLTGLALEPPEELASLSNADIANAFRYAFSSMNRFPDWFYDLAEKKNSVFKSATMSFIEENLQQENYTEFPSIEFSHISHSNHKIRQTLADEIFQFLQEKGEPKNSYDLEIALNIIARSPSVNSTDAANFLTEGFQASTIAFRLNEAWLWLDALFIVNADIAWTTWRRVFGPVWSKSNKSLFVLFLGRERRSFSRVEELAFERNDLTENNLILEQLIKASYLVWPPSRDPRHESVYSPGIADRATDQRSWYLNTLTGLGSKEALDSLDRLAIDPLLIEYRDTFLYQKDKLIRNSSRRPKLSVQESIKYLNTLTKSPTTVDEFRAMVKRHITGLLEKLHHSDDDESYLFRRGGATEDDLRNWLSGRMREIGKEHYEVIREQEVATEKRPDLRIHARKAELGLISVEIKLADKDWTGDVLVDKVQTQLADQYMFENGSHTGYYLLANAAKPKTREIHPKTKKVLRSAFAKRVAGKNVDFEGLIKAVIVKAEAVTAGLAGNKIVEVISVDLSER